jgi:hypothetical protein
MRRIILVIFLIGIGCLFTQNIFAQNTPAEGYNIKIQVVPIRNQYIYFGHYFEGSIHLVDSALLNDKYEATLKGPVKLPTGIYAMFYPDRSFMCDVVIDTLQHFSIHAEKPASGNLTLQFKNSPGNTLLNQYEQYMMTQGQASQAAQQHLKNATGKMDSSLWIHKLSVIDDSILYFKEMIIKTNPGALLSHILIAMRDVKVPDPLKTPKNKTDSAAARQYISDHYWDGVNFWDGSLTYSPFFEEKFDRYFNLVLPKNEDTVIKKIGWMMSYATASETMTDFLLTRLLYGTLDHKYPWSDDVFVELFEKYIAPKTYPWLSAEERKTITEKAFFLMGIMVGKPAPDIVLPSIDGKNISLYAVDAKYTLLCFWDPTCSHCRETLPRIDSIYLKKWKAAGIKIFSVAGETDGTKDDWINFINQHKLQDWANVYCSIAEDRKRIEAGLKGYVQLYDVAYYPSFFLLDKNKKFIAKKLKYEQIVELLETLMNNK